MVKDNFRYHSEHFSNNSARNVAQKLWSLGARTKTTKKKNKFILWVNWRKGYRKY